jgi:hypothetical protein
VSDPTLAAEANGLSANKGIEGCEFIPASADPEDETTGVGRGVPLNVGSSRREERQPTRFLRRFEPFQRFADRKISPPRTAGPPVFPRTTPWMDAAWRVRRDGRRLCVGFLNGGGFGGTPIRFYFFSRVCREENFCTLPGGAALPTLGPLRRARAAEHSGDCARPCDVRPRAHGSIARPPRPATNALARSTTSARRRRACGGGISGKAWPRRILVIESRTKSIT